MGSGISNIYSLKVTCNLKIIFAQNSNTVNFLSRKTSQSTLVMYFSSLYKNTPSGDEGGLITESDAPNWGGGLIRKFDFQRGAYYRK